MSDTFLLHDLIADSARRSPAAAALTYGSTSLDYEGLHQDVLKFASAMVGLGLARGERIGIYLEKRFEAVIASFGATAAGCVFVTTQPVAQTRIRWLTSFGTAMCELWYVARALWDPNRVPSRLVLICVTWCLTDSATASIDPTRCRGCSPGAICSTALRGPDIA
jgi:acyl-CoA synthetase (AMP-forming)/AMP-acid ligase II